MDNNKMNDVGEGSSDGEEDYESADEGETKEKSNRVTDKIDTSESTKKLKKALKPTETGDEIQSSCKNIDIESSQDTSSVTDCIDQKEAEHEIELSNNLKVSSCDDNHANKHELAENIQECSALLNQDSLKTKMEPIKTNDDDKITDENIKEDTSSGSWGSWGSWGAVLNQATASVTSGLSHVIEKVETSLGIPAPGELEEMESKEEKNEVVTTEPTSSEMERGGDDSCDEKQHVQETDKLCDSDYFWGLSSFSNAVTSKGLELVTEGIDALETIGKKTMHVISEGDPGFHAKRNMFQKPTLSQTLREAKEKSAKEVAERKKQEVLETVDFNDEFDRYQGLAHLEALEILSKESEAKIESMLIDMFEGDLEQVKATLCRIENVFTKDSPRFEDIEEKEMDGEFAVEIGKCAMALNLAFVPDKLNQTEEAVSEWLKECVKEQQENETSSSRTTEDIYSHVVTSLANIAAKSIEVFRKVAEMILLMEEEEEETVSAEDRSVHLCKLTKVVTNRISSLSTSYAQCLNMADCSEDSDNITPVITEVYLESSNSSSHVQDAFKLLLPILQVSALNNFKKSSK